MKAVIPAEGLGTRFIPATKHSQKRCCRLFNHQKPKTMYKTINRCFSKKYKKPAISIREVSYDKVCSYGIVEGDKIDENIYRITQLIEKPKCNQISSNLQYLEDTF